MLGRRDRNRPGERGATPRRAIETLESRRLLSVAPYSPAGGFAAHGFAHAVTFAAPQTDTKQFHSIRLGHGAGDGERPDHRARLNQGGLADDAGNRDALRFAWSVEDSHKDGRISNFDHDESHFGSFGGGDWHDASDRSGPFGHHPGFLDVDDAPGAAAAAGNAGYTQTGGGVKALPQTFVPAEVLVATSPSAQSTLVLLIPKGLASDAGRTVRSPAYAPASHPPSGDADRPAADGTNQRALARPEYERAEAQQNRPAGGRDARGAVARSPVAVPANANDYANRTAGQAAPAPARAGGAAQAGAGKSAGVAAAVVSASAHVVDAVPVARAAIAVVGSAQGAGVGVATVDRAAATVWQEIIGRVEAALADLTGLVEAATSADGAIDAVAVAADVSEVGSGLLHLPTGPVMFLGLAPMSAGAGAARSSWWPSQQAWCVTEAVSFAVAVAGYGYCRADAERRRVRPIPVRSGVTSNRRPGDGL